MATSEHRSDDEIRAAWRKHAMMARVIAEEPDVTFALLLVKLADDLAAAEARVAEVEAANDGFAKVLDVLQAERDAAEARAVKAEQANAELTVALAAVEALLPGTDVEYPIFPQELRAALKTTTADGLFIPRAALAGSVTDDAGEEP